MKKTMLLLSLMLVFLFAISAVSASTLIAGKIYNADWSDTVSGAFVNVTCDGNSIDTVSSVNGNYGVTFLEKQCDVGDSLEVYAEKDGLIGYNNWESITDKEDMDYFDMNLGIVNIPLVPEFGFIIGTLTILSAVVVFFFVRRQ